MSRAPPFPKRICAPAFMRRSYHRYAGFLSQDFNILTDEITWSVDMGDEMREFWTEFTDLIFRNNAFAYAVVRYGMLEEKRQQYGSSIGSL
ncbi:MAG: hypothetical protein OXU66_13650 [Gammaproteobacteria bacterium]|nr:hypothetical protein [Gammaproteobacteria bacterium]MDD9897341.1 hypothetical protein [Gammaproteobacteria bacterium]MDD9959964.1 hypothetical protein [Gammaproteobacteria bacterium]